MTHNRRLHPPSLSFRWRILLPTLGLMWVSIIGLALYQYNREETVRVRMFQKQLDMITNKVIEAYTSDADLDEFMEFLSKFYHNTSYSGIRITVYDYMGKPLRVSVNEPIPFSLSRISKQGMDEYDDELHNMMVKDKNAYSNQLFYYVTRKSADGRIVVLTAMPYTKYIDDGLARSNRMWFVIIPLLLIASIAVVIVVNHTSRSVRLLYKFAHDVADNNPIDHYADRFPSDEVGKISAQIIRLYQEKDDALRTAENDHQVALNAIVEKNRYKRELTSNINHELKTPLGIIRGYTETIMENPDMDAEMRTHFMSRIHESVMRMSTLLDSVSAITRLDEDSQQVTLEQLNFHDVMFYINEDAQNSSALGDMKFSFSVPLDCLVMANLQALNGVIYNLIRNSLRHSQGTQMRLEYVSESDDFYTFRFFDDGVGVPEESISHLFDRFYRVDKGRSRKSGDSGLGLTIVYKTIQSFGGAISVKNRSTGGLEFIFTLPKWKSTRPDRPAATTDRNVSSEDAGV